MAAGSASGDGTRESPWNLTTPSGSSSYQMYRDEAADPPVIVCVVGTTTLGYQLRCLDDLHAMLKAHGDWMPLGSADEQKPAGRGHRRGLGPLRRQPGRRLVRHEEGAPRTVRDVHPAAHGGPRARRGRAQPAQQPDAGPIGDVGRPGGAPPPITAAVFDLGAVLIDWDPRHLYRRLFDGDEAAMEQFLAEIATPEWNRRQDAGRSWAEAVEALAAEHPDQRALIVAYRERWVETLGGAIDGTVEILEELRQRGLPLYALSNWSAETWPYAVERYPFLAEFRDIVISGEAGVAKPDPRIYRRLIDRNGLDPTATVFIDDVAANVEAGKELGFIGLLYVDPAGLRRDLEGLGLLV